MNNSQVLIMNNELINSKIISRITVCFASVVAVGGEVGVWLHMLKYSWIPEYSQFRILGCSDIFHFAHTKYIVYPFQNTLCHSLNQIKERYIAQVWGFIRKN